MTRRKLNLHEVAHAAAATLPGTWHTEIEGATHGVTAAAVLRDADGRRMIINRHRSGYIDITSGYPYGVHHLSVRLTETTDTTATDVITTISSRFLPDYEPIYQAYRTRADRAAALAQLLPDARYDHGNTTIHRHQCNQLIQVEVPAPHPWDDEPHVHIEIRCPETIAQQVLPLLAPLT